MSPHLLLVAAAALAAPDTGGAECDETWVAEGTWTGDGCLVTPEPSEVCELLWRAPDCESWDAMVAHALDPESGSRWSLGTCPDGGHVATGLTLPESSTTLYFEPGGAIAGGVFHGDSLWSNGCCDGHLTKTLLYGVPFECDLPDPYVPPPEPADTGSPPLAVGPLAEPTGCGCATAPAAAGWWSGLAALAAARRRTRP